MFQGGFRGVLGGFTGVLKPSGDSGELKEALQRRFKGLQGGFRGVLGGYHRVSGCFGGLLKAFQ